MNKMIKINNFREKYSSHSNIFVPECIKYHFCKYINNNKIINVNNFNLKINNKKIKYSTFYTNPYKLDKNITNMINFNFIRSNIIKINILDNILINKITISQIDKNYLELILI